MKGTGTLELAVLGLLHESPMHGYELRKRLSVLLGPLRALSYGSLYPALKKLKLEGLIEETAPVENLVTRRAKRVYHLTQLGTATFLDRLSDGGSINVDDSGFGVHLAFFSATPSKIRIQILESRRRQLEDHRGNIHKLLMTRPTLRDNYSRELKQLALESAEREIAWLTKLIALEYADIQQSNSTAVS